MKKYVRGLCRAIALVTIPLQVVLMMSGEGTGWEATSMSLAISFGAVVGWDR